MFNYQYRVPEEKRVRYILHTDCKNEADDQYAVVQTLMTPKFDVKGIIAGHFNKLSVTGPAGGDTVQDSLDEIHKILELMHLKDRYPVLPGARTGMENEFEPVDSEGARFIIQEAMREDLSPLFIGMQGAITDLASAILLAPEICSRMTAIWIGGGAYPDGGFEFNLAQDVHAANVVFKSEMPLWQIPINVYKQMAVSLAELQLKVKPHGKIGRYLFEQLIELNSRVGATRDYQWPHGEIWGLGDQGIIAALMEEVEKEDSYDCISAPVCDPETMKYIHTGENRRIRVYKNLNARLVLEDLFCKLAINFPHEDD